jgi:hypothetical protein
VPRRTLQVRIRFVRQWSHPTLEQTKRSLHMDISNLNFLVAKVLCLIEVLQL